MRLDRFYPVMPDSDWVERAVMAGARLVQLRLKDATPEQRSIQVRRCKNFCERAGATLILNDYWELALEEKIDFVHLGQEDLSGADVGALRRAGIRLGISTHDHAELDRALAQSPDYIALGPVYPTLLKVMPWAPQGLERVTEWKKLIGDRPLVAIGGITPERASAVLEAGADSVAVVTDIVRAQAPEDRLRLWLDITRPPA